MDANRLREATRHWVTGVGVVTTAGQAGKQGSLVNNIACVSTDPPLYLACFGNTSRTLSALLESRSFNIHFLARGQQALAMGFAARDGDKFAGVSHQAGQLGAPVLVDALVCLECALESSLEAGGSTVVIGRVVAVHEKAQEPLVMRGREWLTVAPAAD